MRDRFINPLVNSYIDNKQQKFKDDPDTREDIIEDHSFLLLKIYISNIVKILKLVVQMLFIAYYVGVNFVIFSQTIHEFQFVEIPLGEELHHDD
jgi:hypothetical protein